MTPEPPLAPRPTGPRAVARVVAFFAFAACIVGGPFAEQALGVRHPALRGWQMFGSVGMGATQARFFTVGADGARQDVDRFADLAPDAPPPNRKQRRIADAAAAQKIARSLCRRLGADADLRVELLTASRKGWTVTMDGSVNQCLRPSTDKPTRKPKLPAANE